MRVLLLLLALTTLAAADVRVTPKQIITDPIFFETNKAVIKKESVPTLDHVVAAIKNDRKIGLVEIGVHTDARGNDDYNLELSQKRADAIRDYLVGKGVDATMLRAKGYGETKPIDKRATSEAWAKNRRTEFLVLQRKTT